MSIVKVFIHLNRITSDAKYSHYQDEVIKKEIRGNIAKKKIIARIPFKKMMISLFFLLVFLAVILFFDSAQMLEVESSSIVIIASFLVAGIISLIVLNTNYKIEMLKLKEKWVYALREDVYNFTHLYRNVVSSIFDDFSKILYYKVEEGFIVPDEVLLKMNIDFDSKLYEVEERNVFKDMESAYYRLMSKIDDGDIEHREISLNIKLLKHVLLQYLLIIKSDKFCFSDKKRAHQLLKRVLSQEIEVCNSFTSKKIKEVWDKDRKKKTRRNFYTIILYCLLVSTLVGMIVGLSEFSLIVEFKKIMQ